MLRERFKTFAFENYYKSLRPNITKHFGQILNMVAFIEKIWNLVQMQKILLIRSPLKNED